MKSKELIGKKDKELMKILDNLEYELIRVSSIWSRNIYDRSKAGVESKVGGKQGDKTKLISLIKKNIARVKTEIRRREIELTK